MFRLGIPIIINYLQRSFLKSNPSEKLPRHTANNIAPPNLHCFSNNENIWDAERLSWYSW